ncbi:FprA family A-type flavoprotein [Clostridium arbusti]|uniref:FprA family A-type flavoprotein n=1 Tax=Clostridium arbusti TaxID=1137848 RepID=UPI0002883449|nr:FprA family A-type flavoprotein [Clostridium arbusti]
MHSVQEISPQIFWVGGSDRRLELFENMFPLPNGVSYNSYVILDDKTVLLDTVDSSITKLFIENIKHVLAGRTLDYLVINHIEPDHGANIEEIVRLYPDVKIIGSKTTFKFFGQYFDKDISSNSIVIEKEGTEISLGNHTLSFYFAPMVHWPEVMVTYEKSEGILFSADAFGSFGALSGNIFADETDFENVFLDEARRYYTNIVGKYGRQVQSALKKLSTLEINMICSVHGPIWHKKDIPYILDKYNRWSLYKPEKNGVVFVYGSMYGNTENVINALANKLAQRGAKDIRMYDVSKTHPSYIISDLWKYSHMVIAAPTYNLNLYYPMHTLLHELNALAFKNRKVSIIGNHTWASAAVKQMKELIASMPNMEVIGQPLDINSTLKAEQEQKLDKLADDICKSLSEI